jgi:hypothetical protein
MGKGHGLSAAVAAVTAAVALGFAASAQAQLLTVSIGLQASLSAPFIEGIPTGQTQPLDAVGNLVCEPGQTVGGYLPGGQPVSQALCAIPALDLQYVTRLRRENGTEVVRRHTALLNVPTALNVDDDLDPDVIGTLAVDALTLSGVSLEIDRFLFESSKLPLKVEAIVDDPTAGALPRRRINAGYDARDGCPAAPAPGLCAPADWKATATFSGAGGSTKLDVVQDVRNDEPTELQGAVPASVKLLGGLFNGDSIHRRDPMGGEIRYAPVALVANLGVTLAASSMEVRAGAVTTTNVKARAEIVNGPREQRVGADLAGLPQSLSVRMEEPGADRRTVTYAASAAVPSLDASYTDTLGGTLGTKVVAKARGIPTGMVLTQTSARAATFTANGGTLGSVEVGYANGEPRLLPADHPYARVFDDGTLRSYAGRIDALRSASFDATTTVTGELRLGPEPRKRFRALVDMPGGRHIDGVVRNLPRHLKVLLDAEGGVIDYDAFGETIDEIVVDAEQSAPFFGRVRRIRGRIEQLPSQATVNIKPGDSGMRLSTNNPIGKVEALLTSGPDASLPAGQLGAQVEDLASRFTAFGRVEGLQLVDVTTGPGDAVTGRVRLASKPLRLRYLRDGQTIDASLSAIPDDVTVAFDPDAGNVGYNASAGIDSIDATVDSTAPLFGRVRHVRARVERLPSIVSIGFKPASGSGVAFAATPAVGMMQAALTDGVAAEPSLPAGRSGVVMKDVPSEFSLFGRLFEVSSASVTTAGANLDATLKTGPLPNGGGLQDIDLDVTFDTPGDAVAAPARIVGFVEDLPATLNLKQQGGKTIYDASSTVPKVTLDARNLPGGSPGGSLDGGLHNAVGTLTGVPTHFEISAGAEAGVVANGAFTRADLEAWDHGPRNAAFPEDDRNKVALSTRDGRLHVQARVFALSKVLLGTSATTKVETAFGSAPAPLDIAVDGGTGAEPLDLDVVATDLPTSSTFSLNQLLGMRIGWNAASHGTDVGLKLSAKEVGADLTLSDLPSFVDVCVGGGLTGCSPKAPSVFQAGDERWVFPNSFTTVTDANGTIRMGGRVCLPPTDGDGEALDPPGTVYGACLDGTSPNRIEISNLRLRQQRLEFASGDTTNEDGDGDPLEDKLLKLWLEGDAGGIRVDNLFVRNDASDSSTIVKAGHTGGPPLRNSGSHFFLLADLNGGFLGVPRTLLRDNQMECEDLEVQVQLPVLGLTDVLPFPGEVVLGDVCIDH